MTYEHYKGSYSQRIMYTPVILSLSLCVAGVWGAFNRWAARVLLPLVSLITLLDGVTGFIMHVRGIQRKPGGWRIPVFNIVMGPPIFAPLLFAVSGFLGLITAFLRREDDLPPSAQSQRRTARASEANRPDIVTVLLVALGAVLYWRGARYQPGTDRHRPSALEAAAFGLGLLLLLLAVVSPLDTLGEEALAFRLIQHELLVLAVPPLLLMGAPLCPWWLALPQNWREILLSWLRHSWTRRVGTSIGCIIAAPLPVWLIFTAVFVAWHTPPVFDWGRKARYFEGCSMPYPSRQRSSSGRR